MKIQKGAFIPPVQEKFLKSLSDNPIKKREVAMAGTSKQPKKKMIACIDKIVAYRRDTQIAEVESRTVVKNIKIRKTVEQMLQLLNLPGVMTAESVSS